MSRSLLQGRFFGSQCDRAPRAAVSAAVLFDGPILGARALEARYGSVRVLHGVDVEVNRGEIVTLLGSNGVGKTTFIQTVMGMVTQSGGAILYEGEDIRRLSPEARVLKGLAICPEGRRIFANMTVEDNLRVGAGFHRQAEFETNRARVYELFPKLKTLSVNAAGYLSGGEQQQLAVGRALMSEPKLLLMDEPSLGLAPKIVQTIFELIGVLREQGVTILLVEQNVRQALRIADRGYVLRNGRVVLAGTAEELAAEGHLETAYLGIGKD